MKKNHLLVCMLAGMTALSFTTDLKAAPAPGEAAPDFKLTDTNGKSHSLSDFKGKYVVIEWLNHGCPYVVKHYASGNMQKLQKEYTAKDVVWLSVVSSAPGKQGYKEPDEANRTTEKAGASPTAVLIDSDGKTGKLYDAKTTPQMVVINPEGKIIYFGAIDDQPTPDPASVATAKNYVSAALNAAMAGKPVETPVTKSYGCSVKY